MNEDEELMQGELEEQQSEWDVEPFEDVAPTEETVTENDVYLSERNFGKDCKVRKRNETPMNSSKQYDKTRLSVEIQTKLLNIVSNHINKLPSVLDTLIDEDPKGYAGAITQLLKFAAPTLSAQSVDVHTGGNITIEHRLNALMSAEHDSIDSDTRKVLNITADEHEAEENKELTYIEEIPDKPKNAIVRWKEEHPEPERKRRTREQIRMEKILKETSKRNVVEETDSMIIIDEGEEV